MKKQLSLIIWATVFLPLLFTACQKEQEGVYNPKKKIDRIYSELHYIDYEYGDQYDIGKHMSEVWNWDGDRLHSITFYDEEGSNPISVTFSYDGKRISEMSYDGEDYRMVFNYENNLIVSIIAYYQNNAWEIWRFTHTGDKITRIEYEDIRDNNDTKDFHTPTISPLRFILPSVNLEKAKNNCCMAKKENGARGDQSHVYELEWDKDNIQKVKIASSWHGVTDYYFLDFTYDKKMNPFYNSCRGDANYAIAQVPDTPLSQYFYPVATSKNNVLTRKYSGSESVEMTEEYNYTYEGEFPIVQEMNITSYTYQGVPENFMQREVVYYEYK